jgi:hypothetical protein
MKPNPPRRPSIIFFIVDQMGAKWLEAAMDNIRDGPIADYVLVPCSEV